jgi:pimeloyl-ACP methyl ester carboxylesterase
MERPLVLVIRGAMPRPDQLEWLSAPAAEMAFVHLPGFHSPPLPEPGIEAFAAHFDRLVSDRFLGRNVVLVGLSVGALVAAAMRAPGIRARLLVEPFFATAHLWPLHEMIRSLLPSQDADFRRWVEAVLGTAADRIEERDYRHVLTGDVPLYALVGDVPLNPRRPMYGLPSLTTEPDIVLLRAAGAHIRQVRSRHNMPEDAPAAIQDMLALVLSAKSEPERDSDASAP